MLEPFVVHCHVPSSGSAALNRTVFLAHFGETRVMQLYRAEDETAHRLPLGRISWAMRCHAAAGHVPIGFFDRIYPGAAHVIVLRDPVARWLDALDAMLCLPDHPFHARLGAETMRLATADPDAFVRTVLEDRRITRRGADVQTRLASGLARFGRHQPDADDLGVALSNLARPDVHVGHHAALDAFSARLQDIYPPQNPLPPDASMPGTAPRITPDMLTARTLEGIRTVNSFDLKLHDRLTAHRDLSRAAA